MLKIKKKDTVVVLSGKDKGKRGEVLKVFPKTGKVVVSKINMVSKHKKPTGSEPGGIHKVEAPLPISKVMLVNPKTDKPTRPRLDKLQTGERVRVCRKSGEVIV